jgi:hypothetical protein
MRSLRTALVATLTASAVLIAGQTSVSALPYLHIPAPIAAVTELPVEKTQAFGNNRRVRPAPVRPARPAPAPRRRNNNAAGAAVAAGVLGIIAGGIIASQARPRPAYPPGYYDPAYDPNYYPRQAYPVYEAPGTYALRPRSREWYDYCSRRYRSFNPQTGMYTGLDGEQYVCQ